MAELYLSGPDTVTVTRTDDVPAEVFAEMADALAHVALEVSHALRHLAAARPGRVALVLRRSGRVTSPSTTPWSSTSATACGRTACASNVLAQRPEDQADWPAKLAVSRTSASPVPSPRHSAEP